MVRPVRTRAEATCRAKTRYATELSATAQARRNVQSEWAKRQRFVLITPYRCPVCQAWHLTSHRGHKRRR